MVQTDRNNFHVGNIVGGRLHTEWHNGSIAKGVVGLPVICRAGTSLIASCMGIAHSNITKEWDGGSCIKSIVHPNSIIRTERGLILCRHLIRDRGGTYTEVIVFPPIRAGARANIGVSGFL